jgi:hypothetical protein
LSCGRLGCSRFDLLAVRGHTLAAYGRLVAEGPDFEVDADPERSRFG